MEFIVGLILAGVLFLPIIILLIIRGQMSKKINHLNDTISRLSKDGIPNQTSHTSDHVEQEIKSENKQRNSVSAYQEKLKNIKAPSVKIFRSGVVESFVGINILNKVGIALLLAGIAFFVKYSIEGNLLSDALRLSIGLGSGIALLVIGFFVRKQSQAFASILVGGGIATFYFTIGISFMLYDYFDLQTAFVVMLLITAFTVLLSVGFNRVELAAIAISGAYLTYFLVKPSPFYYFIPQVYLVILTAGVLILSVIKKWQFILVISYLFTILIFGFWVYQNIDKSYFDEWLTFGLASLLFVMFFMATILFNTRKHAEFNGIDFMFLLTLNAGYTTVSLIILDQISEGLYKGVFIAVLGFFHLLVVLAFFRRADIDRNFIFLLIGLVITYISLIAPIQLNGNNITLFWGAEAVILVWLARSMDFFLIRNATLGIALFMIISLVQDWTMVYSAERSLTLLWNKGFMATIYAFVSLGTYSILMSKIDRSVRIIKVPIAFWNGFAILATIGILFTGGVLELNHYVTYAIENHNLKLLLLATYGAIFIYAFQLFTDLTSNKKLGNLATVIATVAILVQVFFVEYSSIELRDDFLAEKVSGNYFAIHYIGIVISILMLVRYYLFIHHFYNIWTVIHRLTIWFFGIMLITILSFETDHIVVILNYQQDLNIPMILEESHRVAHPIVWSFAACIFLIVGVRKNYKDLRLLGITTFAATIIKFFALDFMDTNIQGRILVLVSIGLSLLISSFVYQLPRNKSLQVENNEIED